MDVVRLSKLLKVTQGEDVKYPVWPPSQRSLPRTVEQHPADPCEPAPCTSAGPGTALAALLY